ncbi:hypothetical protein GCM10011342_17930 [Aquisalinus flavus]|uniref:Right handed beta helix domain-containing protein n=1 Tax=Aquisalinus flavus TaxID=1526572 RepID=A0A8J2V6U1_9PROT|nr:hypothetical protein GCM10011342_17930 [Aquisalinus flavus]
MAASALLSGCGQGEVRAVNGAAPELRDARAINERLGSDDPALVELPAGTINLSEPLNLDSRKTLRGAGAGVTVLKMSGGMEEFAVGNLSVEDGETDITISDLTIDCNRKAGMGIFMTRVSNLRIENVETMNCLRDGLRVSGKGVPTRGTFIDNVSSHHNKDDGVIILWASREALISNLRSYENGRDGVVFDHSEGSAVNVIANANGGNGIFFRNLFGGSYVNISATRNGRHGLYLQGFVGSTGASWRAQANSQKEEGKFDEIFLTDSAELSYGISRDSVVTGVVTGSGPEFGTPPARYGITWHSADVDIEFANVRFGVTASGDECRAPDNCIAASALSDRN